MSSSRGNRWKPLFNQILKHEVSDVLVIDEDCDDDDESMNWLELIDHGGLVRMYMLIVAMEMEFQAVIRQLCKDHQVNLKIKVTEDIWQVKMLHYIGILFLQTGK